jgi:outer membrane protein W
MTGWFGARLFDRWGARSVGMNHTIQTLEGFPIIMRRLLFPVLLVTVSFGASSCLAKNLSSAEMLGVRMGFWSALDAKNVEGPPAYEILTRVTAPYGEFFFSHGLKKGFALELSLGSYYRGETRYEDSLGYYWKRVTVYPVTVSAKYYPPLSRSSGWCQPYLDAGVSFVSGVENLRIGEYAGRLTYVGDYANTYLTAGLSGGAGVDLVLSHGFVLGLDCKYRWVNFGDRVGGLKNYSGPEVTLGVCYILNRK